MLPMFHVPCAPPDMQITAPLNRFHPCFIPCGRYHYKVPFFGKEINDTAVLVNGNTADIMGQELELAKQCVNGCVLASKCTTIFSTFDIT
jgi:hypothetical protein